MAKRCANSVWGENNQQQQTQKDCNKGKFLLLLIIIRKLFNYNSHIIKHASKTYKAKTTYIKAILCDFFFQPSEAAKS